MKIQFKGHSIADREVEINSQELHNLFEMMREAFEDHITYGRFNHSYPDRLEKSIVDFCNSHSVDVAYDKDRVNFFKAILQEIRNPYQ